MCPCRVRFALRRLYEANYSDSDDATERGNQRVAELHEAILDQIVRFESVGEEHIAAAVRAQVAQARSLISAFEGAIYQHLAATIMLDTDRVSDTVTLFQGLSDGYLRILSEDVEDLRKIGCDVAGWITTDDDERGRDAD